MARAERDSAAGAEAGEGENEDETLKKRRHRDSGSRASSSEGDIDCRSALLSDSALIAEETFAAVEQRLKGQADKQNLMSRDSTCDHGSCSQLKDADKKTTRLDREST